MNEISFRNALRVYSGPIVSSAIFLLMASTGVALLLEAWWLAAVLGLAAIATPVYFYADLVHWVKFNRASQAATRSSFVEAEALLREALRCTESFADGDWRRVLVLLSLVQVLQLQGNYDDAETFGHQGMAAAEKACGSGHVLTLDMTMLLAGIYVEIAQYAKAESLLQRLMLALEAAPASAAPTHVECLRLQGRILSEQGRDAQAESCFRRAHERVVRDQAEWLYFKCALDLAQVCAKRKNVAEADSLLQQVSDGLGQAGATASLLMARCLELHALVRFVQRRFSEAEELQRRALALTETIAGPNMPASSSGLSQLGEILKAQGKLAEAEPYCRAALRLRQEFMAPEHPALAEALENLADLLYKTGRSEEAEMHAQRAGHIRELYSPFRIV